MVKEESRMNKKFLGSILVLMCGLLFFGAIYAYNANSLDLDKIKKSLSEKGVAYTEASLKDDVLKIKFKSKGVKEITSEDISSLRAIRNEARKGENKKFIKDLSQVIESANGEVIYDGKINDIMATPDSYEVSSVLKNTLGIKETEEKLFSVFSTNNFQISKLTVSDGVLGGKLAVLKLQVDDKDLPNVNDLVPKVQSIIEQLNKTDETGIFQYNLSLIDGSKQLLIELSADLVYRDFIWWQSPELKNETWTKSTPKSINN